MISKTFCVAPWVHLSINTAGSYRPCCCQSYLKEDKIDGYIDNIYYIFETSIEDVWNSKEYKEFRLRMLNGERISTCSKCYREEEVGLRSLRNMLHKNYALNMDELDPTGFSSVNKIKYLDIKMGNKCNLKCRMCGPGGSNQWVPDERILNIRDVSKKLDILENLDWCNSDLFWSNLFYVIDDVELLNFSGGEALLYADTIFKFYEECINRGISKNIVLKYITNLTVPLDKYLEYWKHFKEVRLDCSIDAHGKVNEYIRYPSKWKNIRKNLLLLHQYSKNEEYNIVVKVQTAVQMYNILNLIKLFEYLKEVNKFPCLNIVEQPEHYNIRVLDKKKKEIVSKKLIDWYEKNKQWLIENDEHSLYHRLPAMINYLLKEDLNHLYKDFLNETRILDRLRNQKLEDYIPELMR